jgi:hypothetical protein
MDLCTEEKMSIMTPKFGGKLLVCNANVVIPAEDNVKRTYASVVRGYNVAEEDRTRTESYSSIDSGFEGLENIEPLDIEDLKRYPKACSQKNFDASNDSGHEDMDEDDPNDHDFPHISLFSVAMMMRKKCKRGKKVPPLPPKHQTRAAKKLDKSSELYSKTGFR